MEVGGEVVKVFFEFILYYQFLYSRDQNVL